MIWTTWDTLFQVTEILLLGIMVASSDKSIPGRVRGGTTDHVSSRGETCQHTPRSPVNVDAVHSNRTSVQGSHALVDKSEEILEVSAAQPHPDRHVVLKLRVHGPPVAHNPIVGGS